MAQLVERATKAGRLGSFLVLEGHTEDWKTGRERPVQRYSELPIRKAKKLLKIRFLLKNMKKR